MVHDDRQISGLPAHLASEIIGYTFQNPGNQLFNSTVEKDILYGIETGNSINMDINKKLEELLQEFYLEKYRLHHPKKLSRGEKQKIVMCSILLKNPAILVLDEPFSGIDQKQKLQLVDHLLQLKKRGKIILLITHKLEIAMEYSDSIVGMRNGQVIFHLDRSDFPGCFSRVEGELGLKLPLGPSLMVSLAKKGINRNIKCISDLLIKYSVNNIRT
ncbi:MAG: ABC transporter ATP-binding protein [Candidatus Hodarchaeales archaeon]